MQKNLNKKGFTIIELLVSTTIMMLVLIIVASAFILNQKVFRLGNTQAELTQNARITIDLMSREIRQANNIVTTIPSDNSVPELVPHEIEFEDGHVTSQIQYVRYYLDSTDLRRQIIIYYFDSNPSTYVRWDDTDPFGGPNESTIEDKLIGEFFTGIDFYGPDAITIDVFLEKNNIDIDMQTVINPRNS